jgi:hypothetical protein
MGWNRNWMMFGVRVALAALLIQFVASFGHIHLEHSRAPTAASPALSADGSQSDQTQSGGDAGHDADVCDICATLLLAASAQVAAPPALPVPAWTATRVELCLGAPALANRTLVNFRSRAPPAA